MTSKCTVTIHTQINQTNKQNIIAENKVSRQKDIADFSGTAGAAKHLCLFPKLAQYWAHNSDHHLCTGFLRLL